MFSSLLVANRGQIARRVLRTARAMGLRTIAVHSETDASRPFVKEADEAILLGPAPPDDSAVAIEMLLEAAQRGGADALHPGDSRVAASAELARAVVDAGLAWVGPPPQVLAALADWREVPARDARRVDVQVLGLGNGRIVALGDRVRGHLHSGSPVIVESPAPGIGDVPRRSLLTAAVAAAEAAGLRGVGTVACRVRGGDITIAEIRPSLDADHAVAELVTGVDLVAEQLRVAAGEEPDADLTDVRREGHAVALHLRAAAPGELREWVAPDGDGIRVEAAYAVGDQVAPDDLVLATIAVVGPDRVAALQRAREAVTQLRVGGVETEIGALERWLAWPDEPSGDGGSGPTGKMPS